MKQDENRVRIHPCELCSPDARVQGTSKPRYREFCEKVYACKEDKHEQG